MTLEKTLAELEKYCDDITLSVGNSLKWRCYGNLRVRVTGGKFEIKSEHGHPTPLPAAQEMLERVEACLKDIHKMAPTVALEEHKAALEKS